MRNYIPADRYPRSHVSKKLKTPVIPL